MPTFKCADIGMSCGYKDQAPTRDALLGRIATHAKGVHGIDPIPKDLLAKVHTAIK